MWYRGSMNSWRGTKPCSGRSLAIALAAGLAAGSAVPAAAGDKDTLLNVSYDPTRELYHEFNAGLRRALEAEDRAGR